MPKRSSKPKRPSDVNALAASIVAAATDETPKAEPTPEELAHAAAVSLGRLGGLKGGKARAASLSKKRRADIAKKAAKARWSA
jgi:hypothetical protein